MPNPQPDPNNQVRVLGPSNEYVSTTHPARARKLIHRGKAYIISNNPFTIKMRGKIVGGDNTEREKAMSNPKSKYVNFVEYFKEEKNVWVQNISKTQISLEFPISPGVVMGRCIPRTKKPVNLSQYVSWEAIKNSTGLKTILNRRPAKLLLLTEEEAMAYYDEQAQMYNTTREEELDKAFEEVTMLMDHVVPESSETERKDHDLERMKAKLEAGNDEEPETEEDDPQDVLTPKVVGLVAEAGEDVPQAERKGARELKEELEVIEDELTRADLEHLANFAPKSIQKWANGLLNDRVNK
jgi:hypothetical protein